MINTYIKIDGITGGCTAAGHEGEMEVLTWNHSFVQPISPTRSSAGSGTIEHATHSPLNFTKYLDPATPAKLKACWGGLQIATASLTCFRADGATDNAPVKYLTIDLTGVVVAHYSVSGTEGTIPVENWSLWYDKVTYTYVDQKHADGTADANLPATHDLAARTIS